MNFIQMTKEELNEWRRHDVTRAFCEYLRGLDSILGTNTIEHVLGERVQKAFIEAGRQESIVSVISLLTEEA